MFIAIFTLILFLVWSLITFYYKELDDLHSLITKYCFIILLVIHIQQKQNPLNQGIDRIDLD
jgi:uncharacterized membrane protein